MSGLGQTATMKASSGDFRFTLDSGPFAAALGMSIRGQQRTSGERD